MPLDSQVVQVQAVAIVLVAFRLRGVYTDSHAYNRGTRQHSQVVGMDAQAPVVRHAHGQVGDQV
jgi:hypothetical protein